MSELKTKKNEASVESFLSTIEDLKKRVDASKILEILQKATKRKPKMWGKTMVGFGSYDYKYESGREGSWFLAGFSPRKQNLTIYIMPGFSEMTDLLSKLGKHKLGKSCLYINKLSDIDTNILEKIVRKSVSIMRKRYKCN